MLSRPRIRRGPNRCFAHPTPRCAAPAPLPSASAGCYCEEEPPDHGSRFWDHPGIHRPLLVQRSAGGLSVSAISASIVRQDGTSGSVLLEANPTPRKGLKANGGTGPLSFQGLVERHRLRSTGVDYTCGSVVEAADAGEPMRDSRQWVRGCGRACDPLGTLESTVGLPMDALAGVSSTLPRIKDGR